MIPGLQQGLAGDRITRIEGILNGTCNFILSRMEEGAEFEDVLREAQKLGYAEADLSEDVDGFDARAKLVILSRLALRADVDAEEIPCRSIREVTAIDFEYARELGCTIRQIARAQIYPTDEDLSAGTRDLALRTVIFGRAWGRCWWRRILRWRGRMGRRTRCCLAASTAAMWCFGARRGWAS